MTMGEAFIQFVIILWLIPALAVLNSFRGREEGEPRLRVSHLLFQRSKLDKDEIGRSISRARLDAP